MACAVLCLALAGCARPSATPHAVTRAHVASPTRQAEQPESPEPTAPPVPRPAPTEVIPRTFPHSGPGSFRYAGTQGSVFGRAGTILRFHVAVESNLSMVDMALLTAKIDRTLGDPRSWIGSGQVRMQRVPPAVRSTFTIYLATAATTKRMCATGGVTGTRGYTSCRYTGHVVLNLDRWYTSVPYYTRARASLDTYRTYMINHEVGHQLGHGHERCPAAGRPAPVMQQQTMGLHGCAPNPWPFLGGRRYVGPQGHY